VATISAPEPTLIRLENGVRLALDPMPGLETAAVGVWIGVGARMERAEENGIAHLFEHMAFKGAGSRDARAFAEAIEEVGGVMNAATGYERTCYYARVTREHAAFALDMIADIVRDPHWREDDLEKEKGVVAQERGEAFDQPDDRVFELHQAVVYPDQPLGRPILGREETLAPLKPADLATFRDTHMNADRVVIAASGAFDSDALIAAARARFADLAAFSSSPLSPAIVSGGAAQEARKLAQTHLAFSWAAPGLKDPAIYAARLLSEIYGGGMASRLFQAVREDLGLVYAIDSWVDANDEAGRLGVYAGCAAKNAQRVAAMSASILADLARDGPTMQELRRAKAVVGAQLLMGAESPMARAEARAGQVFLHGALQPFSTMRSKLEAVCVDAVQAVARAALSGAAAGAVVGPKTGLGALDGLAAA
jgi:predicted Zn-dependent peptidase